MLSEQDFKNAADIIGCDVASIKAVYEVEAAGRGYLSDGRVKILFEGHRFWKQVVKLGGNPTQFIANNPQYSNVLYKNWDKKKYKDSEKEWDRISIAIEVCTRLNLSPELALDSASYGSFQIMGENSVLCGYPTAHEMLASYNNGGEPEQLASFIRFVKSTHLDDELRARNWAGFAQGYNGSKFRENKYDVKLSAAYKKHSK